MPYIQNDLGIIYDKYPSQRNEKHANYKLNFDFSSSLRFQIISCRIMTDENLVLCMRVVAVNQFEN